MWLVHLLALPSDAPPHIQHRGEFVQLTLTDREWAWARHDVPTCPDCGAALSGPWTDSRNGVHYVMCGCGSHFGPIQEWHAGADSSSGARTT